jgi:hypothetical protein
VSAWFAAGQPKYDVPKIGSYEEWSELIGSILEFAGISNFITNLKEAHEADLQGTQWSVFLEECYKATGGKPFTARELANKISADKNLVDVLPDGLTGANGDLGRSLGNAFRGRRDSPFGDRNVKISKTGYREKGLDLWVITINV